MKTGLLKRMVVMAAAVLVLSGCASYHTVKVDALNDPERMSGLGREYVLASLIEGVDEGDLAFREVARYAERVLAAQGYRRTALDAAGGAGAPVLVEVAASLSDPMAGSRRYSDPVYVYTRGHSYFRRVAIRDDSGKVTGYQTYHYYDPPRPEFVGTVERSELVTEYEKRLELVASELGADGVAGPQLWRVVVVIRDTSSDLRGYLPYLAAVAAEYAGGSTGQQEQVRMELDDPRVDAFRLR